MIHSKYFVFACLLAATGAQAATPAQIDDARAKGLAWLLKNQNGDGSWFIRDSVKVQSTSAALEAMLNAGLNKGKAYGAAVAWLANADAASIDARARKAGTLARAGLDTTSLVQDLLAARYWTDRQSWGAYPGYATSFPDTPLGQAAVRLSGYSYANQDTELLNALACEVLPAQRSDGGWPYIMPYLDAPVAINGSALLPTAITLLELAAQRAAKGWISLSCDGSNYDIATALNNGVSFLLTRKNADNGFGEKGVSTALDTALAYLAIRAVNPTHTSLGPAQDYLLTGAGAPQADGGWNGDPLTTAMAIQTLPAVTLPDQDGDGVPDAVETALANGSSVTVADGRDAAGGNGQGEAGITMPLILPTAMVGQPYSHSLGQTGLSGFGLGSGSLPAGLTLSADGHISGTPSQGGVYNFQYRAAPSFAQLAQLSVSEAASSDGDVPLPGWALALLGGGLATALLRRGRQVRTA